MKWYKSKVGYILVVIYLLGVVGVYIYNGSFCQGWGCNFILLLTILPWIGVIPIVLMPYGAWFVNVVFLYIMGWGYQKIKERHTFKS